MTEPPEQNRWRLSQTIIGQLKSTSTIQKFPRAKSNLTNIKTSQIGNEVWTETKRPPLDILILLWRLDNCQIPLHVHHIEENGELACHRKAREHNEQEAQLHLDILWLTTFAQNCGRLDQHRPKILSRKLSLSLPCRMIWTLRCLYIPFSQQKTLRKVDFFF